MEPIKRLLQTEIEQRLRPNKAVLLYGARRVGKTMLARAIASQFRGKVLSINGEDLDVQAMLSNRTVANYRRLFSGMELVIIDEAQNVPDIGQAIKLIVDEVKGVSVLATGSSSFDLQSHVGEPLVGRATQIMLTPFSQHEIQQQESLLATRGNLESRLIFGSYPEVVLMATQQERREYLHDLVHSYLLKDILAIDGIRNASKMQKLLQLVAFQVGSEVSYDELGRQLGLSRDTVEKYLNLLSQVFVIRRLEAFSRNHRKEISKAGKWYFLDNGVRNAIIGDFKPLDSRSDAGVLWENYLVTEFIKKSLNAVGHEKHYFWRTYDQQEIDFVREKEDGSIQAFEFKWGKKVSRMPGVFAKAYPNATFQVINPDNYLEYI